MRRIFTTATASSVLVLALSGTAVAAAAHHDSRHDDHGHHANRHRRPIQHAHTVKFGGSVAPIAASGVPAAPVPAPAPSPASSTATIASFTNGTLTIRLADGSTVSGRVSEETEIACEPTSAEQGDSRGGPGRGDDQARDDNDGRNDNEEGRNDDNDNERHCTAAALLAGVLVREAELRVSGAGAVWEELELLP